MLAAPESPFAGLVGAGRRAAFRRRLIRRIAAVALLVIAGTLIVMRPGAAGPADPVPDVNGHATGGALLPTGLPSASASPTSTPSASGTSAPGPGDGAGAVDVPPGRMGIVVPIDAALAPRLQPGDRVDIYRSGSSKRVATEALVVDVTRPAALHDSDFGPASGADPSAATATVFVAVLAREAAGIPAGQRGSERSATAWWVTVLPRTPSTNP
ncbi:hypothetical protein GCM10009810_14340 [Nostocoides vanveenii]|uniref:Flp pilus assembly protein RcpC/CpaB domain-containing protein n=1 Tax=Nostocoides vanveenii TaxID=330835 RepID=A0ABP4WPA0_9MICO